MASGQPALSFINPAATSVSATSTGGGTITLTIPATAGLFNYLCTLEIYMFCSTAIASPGSTPVLVTTTGITGTPTISFSYPVTSLGVTMEERIYNFASPLRGSAVNTALTVVCPATTGVLWRVNALYFTDI